MTSSVVTGDCILLKRPGSSTEPLSKKAKFGILGNEPGCLGGGGRNHYVQGGPKNRTVFRSL